MYIYFFYKLYSTRAFAAFLTKRHNYREPDFLAPVLKIDRSPQTQLVRASKRALLAAGKGYIKDFGTGARKEVKAKEQETAASKSPGGGPRKKSVVFTK